MLHWQGPADQVKRGPTEAREVELKFDIDPDHVSKLAKLSYFSEAAEPKRQISIYFDTPKEKLRRNGWVLRVRQRDGKFIQTAKRSIEAAGLFDREEWEFEVDGPDPDRRAIAKTPLGAIVKARQFHQLAPVCRCDIDRSRRVISVGNATVEISLDEGLVEAREACEPVHEIELELKSGEPTALFGLARKIVGRVPVKIGVSAKSERGFALSEGKRPGPVKAIPVALSAEMPVGRSFATIAASCIKHFRMNEPLVIAERDAEALHQLRVAIRRLRSAVWLFRPAIRDAELDGFSDQLRRFTRELGAARNIDVILSTMSLNDPARCQLEDDRKRLYTKIIRKLDSRSFRLFMFDLFAWLHHGKWRTGKKASAPLLPFAIKRIDRLWAKIDQRASLLQRLSDEDRHQLRIDTKKLRYALEFLTEPLRPAGDARVKFVKTAERIQDRLGDLNDLIAQPQLLARIHPAPAKTRARHMRAAKRYLQKLRGIGPYWRRAVD